MDPDRLVQKSISLIDFASPSVGEGDESMICLARRREDEVVPQM